MQKCLELWTEIDNNLPFKGTNPEAANMQRNWSCWTGGQHIFGAKGMDCWGVVDYVSELVRPKTILEIGFNAGHSSCMWLARTDAKVTSVDIAYGICHKSGSDILKRKFPDRFEFIHCDSTKVYPLIKDNTYDLVIVDGGHGTDVCISDCELALKLGAKYLLVDDVIVAKNVGDAVDTFVEQNKTRVKMINKWNVAWGVVLYEVLPEVPPEVVPEVLSEVVPEVLSEVTEQAQ